MITFLKFLRNSNAHTRNSFQAIVAGTLAGAFYFDNHFPNTGNDKGPKNTQLLAKAGNLAYGGCNGFSVFAFLCGATKVPPRLALTAAVCIAGAQGYRFFENIANSRAESKGRG